MPIPSLSSIAKPRSHIGKPKDVQAPPESQWPLSPSAPAHDASLNANARIDAGFAPESTAGAKRRSFLPQRGNTRPLSGITGPGGTFTQDEGAQKILQSTATSSESLSSTASAHSAAAQPTRQSRLRPQSMYQTSSARTEPPPERQKIASNRSVRPVDAASKEPVSQLGISRSQSLRRPAASLQSAAPPAANGHSRTKSTSTVSGLRKDTSDARLVSERPRSLLVPPKTSKIPNNGLPETGSSGVRSSTRLMALKRSASTKTKSESANNPHSSTRNVISDQEPPLANAARREASREEPKKQARPAFSTLQQHFTPRKAGKAPTSQFLHPPVSEAGSQTLSAETVSLQSELLQLHLLHDGSAQVSKLWELSAKRALHTKFDEVASLYAVMRDSERETQEQKNIKALREWSSGNSAFGLVEQIQILSGPLHELPSLVERGGRFRQLVDDFDNWAALVKSSWTAREGDNNGFEADLDLAEGMSESWKAEHAILTRKLTSFSRDLDKLTLPAPGSSITSIVGSCRELLVGMIEELRVMQSIEAAVVAKEREWMESCLEAIATGSGAEFGVTGCSEAWRA